MAYKGDTELARQILDETLSIAPNNFYARAARCKVAFFQGENELSRAEAEELMRMAPKQVSDLSKAAQTFAYMSFDEGVRWAYEEAVRRDWLEKVPIDTGLLAHYYGTSLARGGDLKSATNYWKQATELCKGATLAEANLADMKLPVYERSGPAYFTLRDWLPRSISNDLHSFAQMQLRKDKPEEFATQTAKAFFARNPFFERMIPAMLDTCDAQALIFLCFIAPASDKQPVRDALIRFAQGPRGSDDVRFKLLTTLQQLGYELPHPVSMFVNGKVEQLAVFGFEITTEPQTVDAPGKVHDLYKSAYRSLEKGDGATAEPILRRILEIQPDRPDILNNLAAALQQQGRKKEAEALLDEIVTRFPDYFFGKVALANRLTLAKKFDESFAILLELQQRKQLHVTEYIALAIAVIKPMAAKKEPKSAKPWLDMLRQVAPDLDQLPQLTLMVEGLGILRSLARRN